MLTFALSYKCVNSGLFEIMKAQWARPLNGPGNLDATPRKWKVDKTLMKINFQPPHWNGSSKERFNSIMEIAHILG